MSLINCYRLSIAPGAHGRPAAINTVLCVGCASRETRSPELLVARPDDVCVRCGLDGRSARPLPISAVLDGLVVAVEVARAHLHGQPSWVEDLDEAYDWLLRFDGPIVTDGHIVLLPSDGTPGTIYSVNGTCQCQAYTRRANDRRDQACKHRVRGKLLKRALVAQAEIDLAAAPAPATPAVYRSFRVAPVVAAPAPVVSRFPAGRSAQEEADELFPDR